MFAQQIMAQHARANQPMGILASSPQLMSAVQGFKDGGAVKGYQAGGVNLSNFGKDFADSPLAKAMELAGGQKGFFGYKPKVDSEGRIIAEQGVSPFIPGANQINVNPFEINRRLVSNKKGTKKGIDGEITTSENIQEQLKNANEDKGTIDFETTPKTSKFEDIDPSDPKFINEKNKKALDKKKKEDSSDPSKGDFEAGTTTPKFKELKDAKDKLAKIQETINKPNPNAPIVSQFKDALDQIQTELNKEQKELTVDEVDKLARRYAGLEDNANYDDEKHTAFWMSLIKGGLAIAGGESSNALTNIAKGLSIGVDALGKDLSTINAQERQDRKDLAEARYKVVKDAKDDFLALRTAKVQYLQNKAQLLQSSEQFKESLDFKKTEAANNNAFRAATFEVNLFKVMNDANIAGETLKLKKESLAQDKDLRQKTLDLTIKQLESRENLAVLGEDAKRILAMGDTYASFKDGKFTITEDGRDLLETYLISKSTGKLTDLMESVNNAKETLEVGGVKYKNAKDAKKAAFLYYKGGFADKIAKAKEDPTKSENLTQIIDGLTKQFADRSGGTFGSQSNTANDGFSNFKKD